MPSLKCTVKSLGILFTLYLAIKQHTHKLVFDTFLAVSSEDGDWRHVWFMWVLRGLSWQQRPAHSVRSIQVSSGSYRAVLSSQSQFRAATDC